MIKFYINKVKYVENINNADIDFIPSIMRRRMSTLDKVTCSSLNCCYSSQIQKIVFASKTGEIERLLKIIEQYKSGNEVSPIIFTGSVHNYSISSFLMNIKKSIPYTAISACNRTLTMGFLTALISAYNNILYVYSEAENENYYSLCLNISKQPKEKSQTFLLKLKTDNNIKTNAKDFIDLFEGNKNSIKTDFYTIERINNEN